MSDDITFCTSKCNRTKCFRHLSNIKVPHRPYHSFAYLKGTRYCELEYKKEKGKEHE